MNVYILDADVNNYRGLVYENDDIVEFNRRFDGRSLKKVWTGKEKFGFVAPRLPKGDTPGLSSHIPVFNQKAAKALADFVDPSGELLPITCGGEKFFLFNVTRLVSALDETNSDLERFSDGRIMLIRRYAFRTAKLSSVIVFKLPQKPLACAYVTDPFVQRVKAAGLRGFKFRQVWSSDKP